ncbi:hypothetical protein JCM8115_006810 [Rhodotorula mucilaginosa]
MEPIRLVDCSVSTAPFLCYTFASGLPTDRSSAVGTLALCLTSVSAAPALAARDQLETRGSSCHGSDYATWRSGSAFVCLGKTESWRGAAISAIGGGTITTVSSRLADWILSHANGGTTQAGRRARRDVGNATVDIEIGTSTVTVPYTAAVGGRITIDITAYISASAAHAHAKRGAEEDSVATATLIGGTATYFEDGVLDTCTLDFAIPATTADTDAALAKRTYWTLHTTYWADPGHEVTSLNWNDIYDVTLASYHSLPNGVSQACGYMANSGTWHGAFRHWTGDNGYSVGECSFDRQF